MIRVQREDFDIGAELDRLMKGRRDLGAVVTFTGSVRDRAGAREISEMMLEHYPGMTERELEAIEHEARERWPLQDCLIVHRFGTLVPGDKIVLVITASPHRRAAFEATEFLMDYLKTSAPFWKQETGPDGARWVEARGRDDEALERWRRPRKAAQ